MHSAESRVRPSENHRVGRKRHRDSSVRSLEANAIRGECVDIWSVNLPVAVAAQVIGPQRINSYNDNVKRLWSRPRRRQCC